MRKFFTVLLLAIFLSCTACMSLFFYPEKQLRDDRAARQYWPSDILFTSSDGVKLHGWFFRANPLSRGTVLLLHGNAENLSTHVNGFLWLINKGYNLFVFDYRGYGLSEGEPSVKGVHLDAEAALKKLLSLPETGKDPIIIIGQSIGGSIGIYITANSPYKDRISALVIDSAFSSYRLIAREKLAGFPVTWPFQYPLSFLFNDDYSPIRFIRQVSPVPVLIIHGSGDPVVPVHHGRALYDAALEPKGFWESDESGHIRFMTVKSNRERLALYLENITAGMRPASNEKNRTGALTTNDNYD